MPLRLRILRRTLAAVVAGLAYPFRAWAESERAMTELWLLVFVTPTVVVSLIPTVWLALRLARRGKIKRRIALALALAMIASVEYLVPVICRHFQIFEGGSSRTLYAMYATLVGACVAFSNLPLALYLYFRPNK